MRNLMILLCAIVALTGCDAISPFIGEDLKIAICDRDNDGLPRSTEYCGGTDCDDNNQDVGAPTDWFRDVDIDSFGAGEAIPACAQPDGYVDHNGDCDDTDELVNTDATEVCNGYDDNCDGGVDNENISVWYADVDEDSYGDPESSMTQCDQPDGYIADNTDCDDGDVNVNPDVTEVCDDGIDQDCNGLVDDADGSQTWYADTDGDSYGDEDQLLYSCESSVVGYVLDNQDCDDADYDTSPAAFEACGDGVDNDCDGTVDTDAVDVPWYRDADEDGWGNPDDTTTDCAPPDGYVGNAQDCDDSDTSINPDVEEVCNNGVDDNCDESPGACELAGTISLSAVDVDLSGEDIDDNAGYSIANAGDVNNDGYEDLVVGVPGEDSGGNRSGAAYVVFGPIPDGEWSLSNTYLKLTGEAPADEAGRSVAGVGDVNGDGVDDLAVGAPGEDSAGSGSGAVYVFYGPLAAGEVSLASADLKLTGEREADATGSCITGVGDVNGDGIEDMATSASYVYSNTNVVYILYGPLGSGTVSLSTADLKLTGEVIQDEAGASVAGVGDVNGDGVDDLAVGAPGEDSAGSGSGAVYVFYGPLAAGEVSLASADLKLTGEMEADAAGTSIAGVGDVNGDGVDDLAVGAPSANSSTGSAYVLYGPLPIGEVSLSAADLKLTGEAPADETGHSVAGVGDVNGDGVDDLAVGASGDDGGGAEAGATYVLYGPLPIGEVSLSAADLKLTGEAAGDRSGNAIATLDHDGDGFIDVAVGAYQNSGGGDHSGAAYLIYGLGY